MLEQFKTWNKMLNVMIDTLNEYVFTEGDAQNAADYEEAIEELESLIEEASSTLEDFSVALEEAEADFCSGEEEGEED